MQCLPLFQKRCQPFWPLPRRRTLFGVTGTSWARSTLAGFVPARKTGILDARSGERLPRCCQIPLVRLLRSCCLDPIYATSLAKRYLERELSNPLFRANDVEAALDATMRACRTLAPSACPSCASLSANPNRVAPAAACQLSSLKFAMKGSKPDRQSDKPFLYEETCDADRTRPSFDWKLAAPRQIPLTVSGANRRNLAEARYRQSKCTQIFTR